MVATAPQNRNIGGKPGETAAILQEKAGFRGRNAIFTERAELPFPASPSR